MKHFEVEEMGAVREQLEKEILQRPGVSSREMMGLPLLPSRKEHDSISRNTWDCDIEALRAGAERLVQIEQKYPFQNE